MKEESNRENAGKLGNVGVGEYKKHEDKGDCLSEASAMSPANQKATAAQTLCSTSFSLAPPVDAVCCPPLC